MQIEQLYNEGKYDEVIFLLTKNKDVSFNHLLAFAYQKKGEWEKAMDCWNQRIAQDPEVAQNYCERGVCKFNLRFKHAIQDFDKAVELEPNNPYFYSCRAYVKDKTGNIESAVEDYQKAHDLDPSDAITLNNLGLAEQKLGYTARARERFKNSDDLLGVKTIDSRTEPESTPEKKTIWQEFRKMTSSRAGFRRFWKDIGLLKK